MTDTVVPAENSPDEFFQKLHDSSLREALAGFDASSVPGRNDTLWSSLQGLLRVEGGYSADDDAQAISRFLLSTNEQGFLSGERGSFPFGMLVLVALPEDPELFQLLVDIDFDFTAIFSARQGWCWKVFVNSNRVGYLRSFVEQVRLRLADGGVAEDEDAAEGASGDSDAFPSCTILPPGQLGPYYIAGCTVETLDVARELDIVFDAVSCDCARDVLVWAASHGVMPAKLAKIMPDAPNYPTIINVQTRRSAEEFENGMQAVSRTLDAELIRAFLDAGAPKSVDYAAAEQAGRSDLTAYYDSLGIAPFPEEIVDGSSFVRDGSIRIPGGVLRIGDGAFERVGSRLGGQLDELVLPESLTAIDDYAFAGIPIKHVVVPPGVQRSSYASFYGADLITVYNTIDPPFKYHGDWRFELDLASGEQVRSKIGWMGVRPKRNYARCPAHSQLRDFTVEVKDAETDSVLYRIWLPLATVKNAEIRCLYLSNWDWNARFRFEKLDGYFERLPNKRIKMRVALDRLRWPVELKKKQRGVYEEFLRGNIALAVQTCCDIDDLDELKLVMSTCEIGSRMRPKLVKYASESGCSKELVTLLEAE